MACRCQSKSAVFRYPNIYVLILISIGMGMLTFCALADEDYTYPRGLQELKLLSYYILRSKRNLMILLIGAHVVHLYEAREAYRISTKALKSCTGCAWSWTIQSFFFGIGSLSILQKLEREVVAGSQEEKKLQ